MGGAGRARPIAAIGARSSKQFLGAASAIVIAAALGPFAGATAAHAQTQAEAQPAAGSELPPVNVAAPAETHRVTRPGAATKRAERGSQRRRPQPVQQTEPAPPPKEFAQPQDVRTGTVGYYSNSTSVAGS